MDALVICSSAETIWLDGRNLVICMLIVDDDAGGPYTAEHRALPIQGLDMPTCKAGFLQHFDGIHF